MQIKRTASSLCSVFLSLCFLWTGQAWTQENPWVSLGSTPRAIYGGVGGAHSGKWILAGGYANSTTWTITGDAYLWNEDTSTWASANAMPIPVTLAAAVSLDGKLYVMGGHNTSNQIENRVQVYDFATGNWSTGVTMLRKRRAAVAVALEGHIYLMGGTSDGATASTSVDRLNPATGTWEVMPNLPNGRSHLAATVAAGRIHVVTGFTGCTGCVHNDHWRWVPGETQWQTLPAAPTSLLGAVAFTDDAGRVVLTGGSTYSTDSAATWIFDSNAGTNGTWTAGTSLLGARREPVLVVSTGQFALVGGIRSGQLLTDMEGTNRQGDDVVPQGTALTDADIEGLLAEAVPPWGVGAGGTFPDPLGLPNIDLTEAQLQMAGGRIRLGRVLQPTVPSAAPLTLDWALSVSPAGAVGLTLENATSTWPPTPLAELSLPGLNTSNSSGYLLASPFTLVLAPLQLGSQDYEALFGFNSLTGSFDLQGFNALSSTQAAQPRASIRSTADENQAINAFIQDQLKVSYALPAQGDLVNVMKKCVSDSIAGPIRKKFEQEGKKAVFERLFTKAETDFVSLVSSSNTLVNEMTSRLEDGDTNGAMGLLAQALAQQVIKRTGSKDDLDWVKAMEGDLGLLGTVGGTASVQACSKDYRAGLQTISLAVFKKYMPVASCGLSVFMEAGKTYQDLINNASIRKAYVQYKNGGEFWTGFPFQAEVIRRFKVTDAGGVSAEHRAQDVLRNLFQKWEQSESEAGVRKQYWDRLASEFRQAEALPGGIGNDIRNRLAQLAGSDAAKDRFQAYARLSRKVKSTLVGHGVLGNLETEAARLASRYLQTNVNTYKNDLAKVLRANQPSFAAEPAFCSAPARTTLATLSASYPSITAFGATLSQWVSTSVQFPASTGEVKITATYSPYAPPRYATRQDSVVQWNGENTMGWPFEHQSSVCTPTSLAIGSGGRCETTFKKMNTSEVFMSMRIAAGIRCNFAGDCEQDASSAQVKVEFKPD